MNSGIGALLVELGINTAAFEEGLTKATYAMKVFGKEMQNTFRELGKNVSELAAAFGILGPAGAEIAGALNLAGQAAGKMLREFAGINKVWGGLLAGGAGLAAAFGSVGVSAVGLATHTAEGMKLMKEEAAVAGMSVKTFSQLSYAAMQAGVSQEEFSGSMARLGNKMTQAMQGNRMAKATFDAMGVSVTDSNGKMRDMGAVMSDVANWFQRTTDGAAKNYAAMEIGGRGFKKMIPLLNDGAEGMKKWSDESDALGKTVDDNTAKMAEKFVQSLNTIKAAGDGLANQLTKALLPSLQAISSQLADALKSPDSDIHKMIEGIAMIAKWFIDLVAIAAGAFGEIGQWFQKIGAQAVSFWNHAGAAAKKALHGDFSGANAEVKAYYDERDALDATMAAESKERWVKVWNVINGTDTSVQPKAVKKTDANLPNPALLRPLPQIPDEAKKFIDSIDRETQSLRNLTAASLESQAAAKQLQATQKGEDAVAKQFETLTARREQVQKKLDDMNKEGAETTPMERAAAESVRAQIDAQIAELKRNKPRLIAEYQEMSASRALNEVNTKMDTKKSELDEQIEDAKNLTEAWTQGGEAIARAQAKIQLKSLNVELKAAEAEADDWAAHNKGAAAGLNAHAVEAEALRKKIAALTEEEVQSQRATLGEKLAEETRKVSEHVAALQAEADMQDLSTEAKIRAQAAEAGAAYKRENPLATAAQVQQVIDNKLKEGMATQANDVAHRAAALDVVRVYNDEASVLRGIANDEKQNDGVRMEAAAELFQKTQQTREQLDKMAMSSGNMGLAMKGWIDSLAAEVPKLGDAFVTDLASALNQFNSSLNELITKGRVNFKQLGQSIAKDFLQTGLKGAEGLMARAMGGTGGPLGALAGVFGAGGINNPAGTATDPIHTVSEDMPGGVGDLSGMSSPLSLLSILGLPHLAEGGDVAPGKAYVVGEEHPEFFVPRASGTVVPTLKTGDGPKTTNLHVHFHGVTDADSFKRSQGQIMNGIGNSVGAAMGRR
jgi:hypothetical protein